MQIYLTTSGKKANSTEAVSFTGVTPHDCFLKTPTSVEHPDVILTDFVPGAKYAYIPDFGRYYFVEDLTVIHNDRFVYTLSVDVLGTYRSEILSLSEYCSRSSAGSDAVSDPLQTHTGPLSGIRTTGSWDANAPTMDFSTGSFLLTTVAGGASGSFGSNLVYHVDANTLDNLMDEIFNASSTIYGNDIVDDQVKTYFNPFQYIIGCKWIPISGGGGGNDNIQFGFWTSTYHGNKITAGFGFSKGFTINCPAAYGADDFKSYSGAWVTHDLYVPGFGWLPVGAEFSGSTLNGAIAVDYATGEAYLEVSSQYSGELTAKHVLSASGQLSVPVGLSQLSVDVSNVGTTVLGMAGSLDPDFFHAMAGESGPASNFIARLGGVALNAASKIFPGVGAVMDGSREAMSPTLASCGQNGNRMSLSLFSAPRLVTRYYSDVNKAAVQAAFNKSDNAIRTLSGLSGFAVCKLSKAPDIGTATEAGAIMSFLSGGVYIE